LLVWCAEAIQTLLTRLEYQEVHFTCLAFKQTIFVSDIVCDETTNLKLSV